MLLDVPELPPDFLNRVEHDVKSSLERFSLNVVVDYSCRNSEFSFIRIIERLPFLHHGEYQISSLNQSVRVYRWFNQCWTPRGNHSNASKSDRGCPQSHCTDLD